MKNIKRFLYPILAILIFLTPLEANTSDFDGYGTIATEHLEIIYEPVYKDAAMEVASFGDSVYESLKEALQYKGDKKVPVVITGRTAWANGYFAPFPSRITLFVTSDDSLFLGHRSSSWLYSLFTHELTHYLHLTNPIGPASFLTPIFGPEVPAMNTILMSGWWIEGITTNTESIFASGGRGDNERFKMLIKASLLKDEKIWSLAKGSYSSLLPPSGRIYLTGYVMVDYIIRNYGISAFNEINKYYTQFPFFGLSPAIKRVTTESASSLYEKALQEFKLSIDEQIGKEGVRISQEEIASYDLIDCIEGILYTTKYTLDDGVSLTTFDSNDEEQYIASTIPTEKNNGVSITKDRKKAYIIFQSGDYFHPSSLTLAPVSYSDIYEFDLTTQKYTQLTHQEKYYQVQVDEDHNRLIALESIEDRYRLVAIDLENKNKEILFDSSHSSIYFPSIHPSGQISAIVIQSGNSSLVVYNGESWNILVGPTRAELRNPRFMDENTISFVSDFDKPYSLYSVSTDSKEVFLRYRDSIGIVDGIIQPEKLYYSGYRSTGESVFKVESSYLLHERRNFPPQVPEETEWTPLPEYEENEFVDYPRFDLWLPLPYMEENAILPGAWTMWTSVLQRHLLQGQGGWNIQEGIPRASFTYQFTPGPFTFSLKGELNAPYIEPYKMQSVDVGISLPLRYVYKPSGTHFTQSTFLAGLINSPVQKSIYLVGQIGHSYNAPRAPLDTFGTYSYSLSYALQDSILLSNGTMKFISILRGSISIPSFLEHQNISIQIGNVLSHGSLFEDFLNPQTILPPLYLTGFGKNGYNKTKISLYYDIPIAPLDIPFLYGGFNEINLSFHTAGYMYVGEDGFFLDNTYLFGAKVSLNYTLSAGANISPFIGFEFEATSKEYAFQIGITSDILYIGNDSIEPLR